VQVRSDGVHLTPQGVRWLAPWLVRDLFRAARI
jgi:lysophospholipase L1-like esterase